MMIPNEDEVIISHPFHSINCVITIIYYGKKII